MEIVNAAVGDQSGEMPFFEEEGSGETSSLAPGVRLAPGIERTVPVTTLDEELAQSRSRTVDFCKVDAEGFDLRVMKGARSLCRSSESTSSSSSTTLRGRTRAARSRMPW